MSAGSASSALDRLRATEGEVSRLVAQAGAADPRWWALALAALALTVRLPLILNGFSSSIVPDSGLYVLIADELLDGNGFVTEAYRTAGYPLFIAPLSLLPGPTTHAVVIAQHLLGVGLVAGVFWIGDRYLGRLAGILAALLVALSPPMMLVEHYLLPDFLFGVLVLAGAVALLEAVTFRGFAVVWLVASGVLFGIATHVKPIGQVLIVVAPIALAFATRSWRPALRGSAIVCGAMVLTILPWIVHNAITEDQAVMSIQGKQALWLRVFDDDKLPIPTDSEEGALTKRLYDEYFADPPSGYGKDPASLTITESYSYVYNELLERGYSAAEAADLQGDVAIDAIEAHPRTYLTNTVENVADYARLNTGRNGFESAEISAQPQVDESSIGLGRLVSAAWDTAQLLTRLGLVFSLALLAVPLMLFVGPRRSRAAVGILVLTWAAVAVGGSLTANVEPRYAAQIAPLQWLPEAAAAVFVAGAVIGAVRRLR